MKPDPDLATNLNPDPKSLKSYPDSAQHLNPDLAPNPDFFFINSLKKTKIGLKLQVRSWWVCCVLIAGCCVLVPLTSRLTLLAVRVDLQVCMMRQAEIGFQVVSLFCFVYLFFFYKCKFLS